MPWEEFSCDGVPNIRKSSSGMDVSVVAEAGWADFFLARGAVYESAYVFLFPKVRYFVCK